VTLSCAIHFRSLWASHIASSPGRYALGPTRPEMGLAPPFSPKAKRLCFLFSHLACSCRTANHVDMECSTACRTKCPEAFLSLSRELKSNSQCTAQLWIGKAKGGRAPRHRGQDERGGNQREQQHTKKKKSQGRSRGWVSMLARSVNDSMLAQDDDRPQVLQEMGKRSMEFSHPTLDGQRTDEGCTNRPAIG